MKPDILLDRKTEWFMTHSLLVFPLMFVCGKIIKTGPDVTLAQVLEISRLETATQQSLSQCLIQNLQSIMSDMTRRIKGEKPSQQQTFGKFH